MEFTYTAGGSSWDPTTHSYNGNSEGTWEVVDGGGTVTVENLGDQSIYAKFTYTSNISGVTGSFDIENTEVESKQSVTSKLTLAGTPDSQNATLGRVDITISPAWAVGDEVTWCGDSGKAYTCIVVSKSDSGYVLITKSSVESYKGKAIYGDKATDGGRLPDSKDDEGAYMKKVANKNKQVIVRWGVQTRV